LASHILLPAVCFWHAASADDAREAKTWLRLGALTVGFLPFAKNEGFALYAPLLLLTGIGAAWMLLRKKLLTAQDACVAGAWAAGSLAIIGGPWIVFKAMNGLVFGNAHSLSGFLSFSWHEGVLTAIGVNSFLEGNWLLLFPLLILLLAARQRTAFRTPLLLLTGLVLAAYAAQFFVYLFTDLASEAIMQTGYSRGVVQILPLAAILVTMLIRDMVSSEP
jgi:hypothetical protein